jgi:hypothetical protein
VDGTDPTSRSLVSRLTPGDRVVVASGLALGICSFLPWYGIGGVHDDGWDSLLLGVVPVLVAAALVVQVAVVRLCDARPAAWRVPRPRAEAAAAGFVFLLVLLRVVFPERIDFGVGELTLDRQYGLFLALVASGGVAVGGYLRLRDAEPPS